LCDKLNFAGNSDVEAQHCFIEEKEDRNNHAGRSKLLVRHVMLPLMQFILFCLLCFQNILKVRPSTEEESEVRDQF
jgi:hypothetical protein